MAERITVSSIRRLLARARRSIPFVIGGALLVVVLIVAIGGPKLAPYDPLFVDLSKKLQPPSAAHWAGTDNLGRDILSRLLHGARSSLVNALLAVALAGGAGSVIGLISGVLGGWVDYLIQRLVELMLSFPGLLMALAIVAILGPGERNVMLAVAIASVPGYIRLVRGEVLGVRNREFVEAAYALGSSRLRVMYRHIFPNIVSPILVVAMLDIAGAIQAIAAMSYLGMGAQPPEPSWGKMVADGQSYLRTAWWVAVLPGVAVAASVLGINLFGDALRNVLDPRLPRTKQG